MPATILDGRARSREILTEVAREAEGFLAAKGRPVGLAFVAVGDDGAQTSYLRGHERAAREVGFFAETHHLPAGIETGPLARFVRRLGEDDAVDGILVGLPLPEGIDAGAVLETLPASKDVDGVCAESRGRLLAGLPGLRPSTPLGVMDLLAASRVPLSGREAVVLGRSGVVGRPMALMLLEADATVTVLHSKSHDVPEACRRADVLIVAVGRQGFVTHDMVKPGSVVVDVGIHPTPEGLRGDVDPGAAEVAGAITPVPGGVGPMTVAMLMKQTLEAARCRS